MQLMKKARELIFGNPLDGGLPLGNPSPTEDYRLLRLTRAAQINPKGFREPSNRGPLTALEAAAGMKKTTRRTEDADKYWSRRTESGHRGIRVAGWSPRKGDIVGTGTARIFRP